MNGKDANQFAFKFKNSKTDEYSQVNFDRK